MESRLQIILNQLVTCSESGTILGVNNSLLVNISGKDQAHIQEIAEKLDLLIGKLPLGEATPSSDLLIILGSDIEY